MQQEINISNFTSGEISPKMKSRIDVAKYFNGCATELNMVTIPQGGATMRPGTVYVASTKNQSLAARVKGFVFSTVQAYMLEFGQGYVRVNANDAQVVNPLTVTGAANNGGGLVRLALSPGTAGLSTGNTMTVAAVTGTVEANGSWTITVIDATHVDLQGSAFVHAYVSGGTATAIVETPVPYQAADLHQLKFTQSDDTLYICHPLYPPATLTRSSNTTWTYAAITFRDGPYLPLNTTPTTLTPSAISGTITLTASSVVGINATPQNTGQGFLAGDIGRLVRIKVAALWGWCVITAITSPTVVTAIVQGAVAGGAQGALDGTAATVNWRLGKWCGTTGYPFVTTFWQQRLLMCGTINQPNALEASVIGDFTNFAPSGADGTVVDTNALSFVISDDQVNAVRWISACGAAQMAQLGIGTTAGENVMQPFSTSAALTPTNLQVYRETALGSAPNVTPQRIGKSVLFANRTGRKVHEWTFQWQVNGYVGPDLTVLAEHITRPKPGSTIGIVQMAYQQSPHSVVWAILSDGSLIGLTYLREQDIVAWHHHQLGGQYYGGAPVVESLDVIPSPDGSYDELWLEVLRTVNGVPARFIEVMSTYFDGQPLEEAFFVDAGVSSPLTFPAATLTPPVLANASAANPSLPPAFSGTGVFAASAAVFSAGNVGAMLRVNGGRAIVLQFIDAEHVTAQVLQPLTNLAPAAAAAWSLSPVFTSFSGVGHLNGETVAVLGDGATFGTQVASGGAIALPGAGASLVAAGLPYSAVLVSLPFEPQRAGAAVSAGKMKRIDTIWLRFHESLGCNYGRLITDDLTQQVTVDIEPLETRNAGNPMGQAPPLFSGMKRLPLPGGSDREGQIIVTQTDPLPLTVLGIVGSAELGEAA